jgi:signal transduction histidine kinase
MTHPEDVEDVALAMRRLLGEGRTEPFSFRVLARDGVERTLLARVELLYDESGHTPVMVAGTLSDESARLRTERLVTRGEKLIDVGRVVGSVAHDWNNLLSVIVASATLAGRASTEPAVKAELKRLLDTCESSATLLRQMLAFSRRQELTRRVIGLDEVLAPIEWMVRRLLGPRVELVLDITRDPWQIVGDPGGIERAVVNLALNAREAMAGGGYVTIRVENRAAAGPMGKEYVVLSVIDDGAGMSQETAARAFEPFFTTRSEGTGLGLSTVQAMVKSHGGKVELESAEGQGTTVRLSFPRAMP